MDKMEILGIVGSLGTVRAQNHLRQILVTLDMPVVNQPEVMIGNAEIRFDANGRLIDEQTRGLIRELLGSLLQLTRIHAPGIRPMA